MRRLVPLVVLASLLALPSAAGAATKEYGSDLSARATLAQSHPRDWAAWPTAAPAGGTNHVAEVEGEVTSVTFKGFIPRPTSAEAYPDFHVNVAVLRKQAGGTYQVVLASEFLDYSRMVGNDPSQTTTYDLKTELNRVCVEPGDIVTVATSGGFGNSPFFNDGVPMQIFASTQGASVAISEEPSNPKGFEGTAPAPRTQANTELLMRYTISTGDDARPFCRSGAENQNPTVELPDQGGEVAASGGKAAMQLRCASVRACAGTFYLKAGDAIVAEGPFNLSGGSTGPVPLTLNPNGARKLREAGGRLAVTAIVRPSGGAKLEKGGFFLVGGGGSSGGSSVATPVKPKASLPVRKGKVTLSVRCEGSATCKGKLKLAKLGASFGSASFSVPGGSARAVAVALTAEAKRALRKASGPAISAKATAKTASGAQSVIVKIKTA